MSKHDWGFLFFAGWIWWSLTSRMDWLGKQLHSLKIEVVKLSGDKERVQFLEQLQRSRNWDWSEVIGGVIWVAVLGWLLLTANQ